MVEIKDLEAMDDPVTVCHFVDEIVDDIKKAQKSIKIYSGELHRQIFSAPEVLTALREAKQRGVTIQILSSPVLSAWLGRSGPYAPIWELQREGVIEMRQRENRGENDSHFRLIDDAHAVVESYHEPLGLLHAREARSQSDETEIKKLKEKFDQAWKETKESKEPLLLSPSEIKAVKEKAKEKAKNYDTLTINDIEKLYKEVIEQEKLEERQRIQTLRAAFNEFV